MTTPPNRPGISKRWHKHHNVVLHANLAVLAAVPLFAFQMPWTLLQTGLFVFAAFAFSLPALHWLHRRLANTYRRVYPAEYEMVAQVTRRMLYRHNIPFTQRQSADATHFHLRLLAADLTVEAYALNLPIDDHLTSVPATKVTLRPETARNAAHLAQLRQQLDAALAFQGVAVARTRAPELDRSVSTADSPPTQPR